MLAVFAALPNFASAQSFVDETAWLDSLCGQVVNDELDFGQVGVGFPLEIVLPTAWGMFDYSSAGFTGNNGIEIDGDTGLLIDDTPQLDLIPNPALGNVEGISFGYFADAGELSITLADGSTIVVPVPAAPPTDRAFFGWTNDTGQAVTSVSYVVLDTDTDDQLAGFYAIGFSFGDLKPTTPSCQDQLQSIVDALIVKLDSATGNDRGWIEAAIYELECAQNPLLFETEDRLSDYGNVFFGHNFHATYFLQCVSDQSLVEDCLISIQNLLACVVEAEIAFAIENPDVDANFLAYAEYFEEYAELYADYDLYLEAVLLYFYAWLFANNA